MGHPWPVNELRTSCAHPLRGLILRNLAATDGAPGRAGGFLPPEATATATAEVWRFYRAAIPAKAGIQLFAQSKRVDVKSRHA